MHDDVFIDSSLKGRSRWFLTQGSQRIKYKKKPSFDKNVLISHLVEEFGENPEKFLIILSPMSRYREKASAMTVLKGASASSFGGVEDGGTAKKSDRRNTSQSHDENLKGKNISFGSTQERSEVSSTREIGTSDSANEGSGKKLSAKSQLFEICVARKWKIPSFECWKEEGPPHMRMFTFKVIVEIDDESKTLLECFSSPHSKKKAAAEHAAEGALWYLKNVGHHSKDR